MLFQELLLAGDVAAIALGKHVFATRLDVGACKDACAHSRLDGHLEELLGDDALELDCQVMTQLVGLVFMDDKAQRVNRVACQQDVELDQL